VRESPTHISISHGSISRVGRSYIYMYNLYIPWFEWTCSVFGQGGPRASWSFWNISRILHKLRVGIKRKPGSREICENPIARIPTIVKRRQSMIWEFSSEILHARFSDNMRSSCKLNVTSGVKPVIRDRCDHYFVFSFLALDAVKPDLYSQTFLDVDLIIIVESGLTDLAFYIQLISFDFIEHSVQSVSIY